MALIFQRLARNFIKNGYFPTDEVTLARILTALDIRGAEVRILDPCCGEGVAAAEVKQHLTDCGAKVTALGIEYDRERAYHAKGLLDRVVHSDVNDVVVTPRSTGLLFLNPPYGDVVADKAQTGSRTRHERLEKIFFRRSLSWLQFGGVLVLIIPHYVLDADFAALIARHFERVRIFMAPEQKFKQCVIFGAKRRADTPSPTLSRELEAVGRGDLPPELPVEFIDEPYAVPSMTDPSTFAMTAVRIDAEQLADELRRYCGHTLWPQFASSFGQWSETPRRPLRDLSKWHLALALAAGQICGEVRSHDGRTFLIKGDTFKEKETTIEVAEREDGSVVETRILTDKFVPVIRGIDFTPGPTFGAIVTIR